jgi:DNA-binding MarR family transcriptional regulator
MNSELQELIDLFLKILHLYSVINRKPKDYGTGDLLFFTELHTISMVAGNREINMTRLADIMGVTRGAISQIIRKLVRKELIIKDNINNRKEVILKLSAKGMKVLKEQDSFQKEIFTFADTLYERAKPEERDTVRRLFIAIVGNMQQRVKAL